MERDKLIDEIVSIAQASAFNNEFNQDYADRLADELVSKLQPTQFKVATEDSCEVLVEPEKPTFYDEWKSELDKGLEHDFDKQVMLGYQDRLETYDEAPLISQDRLKLNKALATIKVLEKDSNLGFVMLYNTHRREEERLKSALTEANKQLKEREGDIKMLRIHISDIELNKD